MKKLLLGLALLCAGISRAQQPCGTDEYRKQLAQRDPAFAHALQQQRARWIEAAAAAQRIVVTGTDTVYEIPVVVHVFHVGEPLGTNTNYTDSWIASLLDSINVALAAQHPAFPNAGNGGVRVPVRFVLAKTGPNCKSTTGIQRINAASFPNYASQGYMPFTSRALDTFAWPGYEYCNIFMVNQINAGQAAGLAFNNGIVLASGYFYPYGNGIGTPLHELGHYLSLEHVFEGDNGGTSCPPAGNCASTGDLVCDTEPTIRWPSCTPTLTNPCTGVQFGSIRTNFMNYSTCDYSHFTPGQRDKMLFYLREEAVARSLKSLPLTSPLTPAACSVSCANDYFKLGGPMLVELNTIQSRSYSISAEAMAYRDYSCTHHTELNAGQTYPIRIETESFGLHVAKVFIDFNDDGTFAQPAEQVFSSINPPLHTGTITIPFTAVPNKPLRMRVVTDTFTNGFVGACGQLVNGQAEDYAVTIRGSTGVEDVSAQPEISVYPNPVVDKLFIEQSGGYETAEILAADGRLVRLLTLTGKKSRADVSALPDGVYLLRMSGKAGTVVKKFIK